MEKQIEVKTFEVHKYCDKCGTEMTFTGETLLSNPLQYVHMCEKCGKKDTFLQKYPCIEYKEVQRNPITGIEISDEFSKTLNCEGEQYNENNKPGHNELTFALNTTETQEYYDFCNKHRSCGFSSTIGGKISVIFTPTGLGEIVTVKCNSCGEEKDITDVSNW